MTKYSREYSRPAKIVYKVEMKLKEILDQSLELGIREVEMFGSTFTIPQERRFGSLESVHSYLDQLTGLKSFFAEFGSISTPKVKEVGKDATGAYRIASYDNSTISLAQHGGGISSHLREIVVIHELAHHIEYERGLRSGKSTRAGHSKAFLDTLLSLSAIAYDDPMFSNLIKYMLLEEGAKL